MPAHRDSGPLLVFGPRSTDYDFGPGHPLTPRRFAPSIELLQAVGAKIGLSPEPATDPEILRLHSARYVAAVRRLSDDPMSYPEAGIGPGDDPAFVDMHEAAAAVAGGSLRAMEAILRADVEHAYHPGGGLHHAMRDHASGFCIYNDPALAIARARDEGQRVMYVDVDVHHGDGVEALHLADPGVLTVSFHETGQVLFPGTGFAGEIGEGSAAATAVNVPLEPLTGPGTWLAALETLLPPLAAAFAPDVIVSQHGCDSHAWDPLAHLLVTTEAMGAAARLVDRLAHRYAGGRWLATGGGGYDAYRVVPRAWALTWLAGAHREPPDSTPPEWRERWSSVAARYHQVPMPERFDDPPGTVPDAADRFVAEARDMDTVRLVRALTVPAILAAAEERGWWKALASDGSALPSETTPAGAMSDASGAPTIVDPLTPEVLEGVELAARVIAPADPFDARVLLLNALGDGGARAVGAIAGSRLVGVALAAPVDRLPLSGRAVPPGTEQLLALGVAPAFRRSGLADRLLGALASSPDARDRQILALFTPAERDPFAPLPIDVRLAIAAELLARCGFRPLVLPGPIRSADATGIFAVRSGPETSEAAVVALREAVSGH